MWDNDLNSIHKRRSYSTTFKIFLTSNSSRKLKNLHFFDDTFIFCSHFLFLCNMAYNGGLTPTQQKSHPETGAHGFLIFFYLLPSPLPSVQKFFIFSYPRFKGFLTSIQLVAKNMKKPNYYKSLLFSITINKRKKQMKSKEKKKS